jgi:hypothetical protein
MFGYGLHDRSMLMRYTGGSREPQQLSEVCDNAIVFFWAVR